jgi:hypothetical protein
MKHRLSLARVADIAMIATSIFVVVSYARVWSARGDPAARPSTGYAVGDVAPTFAGVSYAAADRSLLLFVNSACGYCTDSMPFYSTLAGKRNERHSQVALIALSKENQQDLEFYLASHRVAVDRALSVRGRSDLKFMATPTLVLINRAGQVLRVWMGALPPDKQREVLKAIEG